MSKEQNHSSEPKQPQGAKPPAVPLEPLVRHPGVFCCWIHATRCNFIGPEKTCKLGEIGECPHKFIKPI